MPRTAKFCTRTLCTIHGAGSSGGLRILQTCVRRGPIVVRTSRIGTGEAVIVATLSLCKAFGLCSITALPFATCSTVFARLPKSAPLHTSLPPSKRSSSSCSNFGRWPLCDVLWQRSGRRSSGQRREPIHWHTVQPTTQRRRAGFEKTQSWATQTLRCVCTSADSAVHHGIHVRLHNQRARREQRAEPLDRAEPR